jgi:hypothetical protein
MTDIDISESVFHENGYFKDIPKMKSQLNFLDNLTFADPIPLMSPAESPKAYPVDALPTIIRNAVLSYQNYGQQPLAMVATSALASLSLCAQGLANVARDNHLIGPISLNIISVASSGERKTSCDRRMAQAPRKWQQERREAMAGEVQTAHAMVEAHKAEREGFLAKIKLAAGCGIEKQADIAGLKVRLQALEENPPREAMLPSLFHEDVTPEALAQSIGLGWPSSSLWSDEAGLVVGAHGMNDDSVMRFLGLLNRLWDGSPFERKRSTAKSFVITGRRLTVSLMMQEVVMARLLAAGGGVSRGLGFMARFLVAAPESTMGTRLYRPYSDDSGISPFDDRLLDLLDLPLPTNGPDMALVPVILPLSQEARKAWISFHDEIERDIGRSGQFCDVPDFAAKAADNAARIAALFHILENGPGSEVSKSAMEAGAMLASFHLFEAKRMIGAMEQPQAVADASALLDWVLDQGMTTVTPRTVQQSGPGRLRDKGRRDAAIETLVGTRHLIEDRQGKATTFIVNPKIAGRNGN